MRLFSIAYFIHQLCFNIHITVRSISNPLLINYYKIVDLNSNGVNLIVISKSDMLNF